MKKNSPKTTQEKPTRSEEHSLSVRTVLDERRKQYGAYEDVSNVSQALKAILHPCMRVGFDNTKRESLDMICNKLARIVCGDSNLVDSWKDIAGYAQLIVDRLE